MHVHTTKIVKYYQVLVHVSFYLTIVSICLYQSKGVGEWLWIGGKRHQRKMGS